MFNKIKTAIGLGEIPKPSEESQAKRNAFRQGLIDMDELRERLAACAYVNTKSDKDMEKHFEKEELQITK